MMFDSAQAEAVGNDAFDAAGADSEIRLAELLRDGLG